MADKVSLAAGGSELWRTVQRLLELQRQAPPLCAIPRNGPIPASFQQERLWLLQQAHPAGTAYHLPTILRIEGALSPVVLDRSLCAIVRRHEILRTTLHVRAGQLEQAVEAPPPTILVARDVSEAPQDEREVLAMACAKEIIERPFDLERDWPLRAMLIRVADDVHWLTLLFHHIAFDAWSEGIFFRELAAAYEMLCKDAPEPLPVPALQYGDYAVWQRRWLTPTVLAPLQEYWKESMQPAPEPLRWPADGVKASYSGGLAQETNAVETAEFRDAFSAWARKEGATPFVAMLAAFLAALREHTGQERPYVCSPVAGRTRPEVAGLIGYFVNLVLLVGPPGHSRTFREYLTAVRGVVAGAMAYQDLPIHLLAAATPELPSPLARVMFSYQNRPVKQPALPGLSLSVKRSAGLVDADADLFLTAEETREGLLLSLQYSAAIFARNDAERLLDAVRQTMRHAMENADVVLKDVGMAIRVDSPGPMGASAGGADGREYVAPADDLERGLADIWQRVLNVPRVGATDDFFLLGGRSLLAMRMLAEVKRSLGYQAEPVVLAQARTVRALARTLREGGGNKSAGHGALTCLQDRGRGLPVFLVPPAGATPLQFASLARHLAPDHPVYGIEYPGMDGRCAPLPSVEALARHHIEAIRTVCPSGPYVLGGRCFGGIVAYEMAQQLTGAGEQVAACVILDTVKPPGVKMPFWDDLLGRIMDARVIPNGESLPGWRKMLWVPQMAFRKIWRHFAKPLAARDSGIPPDHAPHVRRVHTACEKARRAYRPAERWSGELDVAYCARRPALQRVQERWQEHAAYAVFHPCRGAHVSLLDEPYVVEVAEIFRKRIAAGEVGRSPSLMRCEP